MINGAPQVKALSFYFDEDFIAFAIPFGSVASKEQLECGLHLAITDVVRIQPSSVDPTVKNYHWLDMIKGLYAAYERGADTAILIDVNSNLSEGPGFNIFSINNGVVSTPDVSVLLGITRQTIFDICEELEVICHAQDITVDKLKTADEVFITSTAGGIMPVTRIDERPIASGNIGLLSKRIMDAYWQMHNEGKHRDPVKYFAEWTL
jgi:branched-chain amino acid aminotransferase